MEFFEGKISPTLIEVRIKPGCFTEHRSKDLVGLVGGHGSSELYHDETYYRIPSEKNVFIKSITFINLSFLSEMMMEPGTYYCPKENIVKPNKILKDYGF